MLKSVQVILFTIVMICYNLTSANNIQFTSYNLDNYPIVKGKFFLYSNKIMPDFNFNKGNLQLKDNSAITNIDDFQIPFQDPYANISLVTSLDLSVNNDGVNSNFKLAKKIIETIIDSLPATSSEMALSSFDMISYLNSEFTNNKISLKNALSPISSKSGAIIEKGFNYKPSGSIEISKNARFKKAILLITDGNKPFNPDQIILNAASQNIKIFCFVLSKTAGDNYKKIASSTGGQCFENVNSANYEDYINQFVSFLYNFSPCEITWTNNLDCETIHNIELTHIDKNISGQLSIEIPDKYKPTLELLPPFLQFSSVVPGNSKPLNISLMAKNKDITITDISITGNEFAITSGYTPGNDLIIRKGETKNLTVTFTPTDSNIIFAVMTIESDACFGKIVYMTGGFPNKPPKNKTLMITSPNGGENLIAGDSALVEWTGLLPKDVIQLEYTIDSTAHKWDTLALDVTGLNYKWLVPPRYSDSCLIRSIQLWPNNIGQTLDFSHKNLVYNANFNKLDGSIIITSCQDSIARIWNSYTGSVLNELKGHTGIVRWANFDPTEKYAITASQDKTAKIWDKNTGKEIRTLYGHTDELTAANFNNDGKLAVTSSYDGKVFIWDVATGSIIKTPCNGTTKVRYATFCNDGANVLFCVGSKAKIYNLEQDKVIKEFNTNNITVYSANFNAIEDKIVTTDINGYAIVWDIVTGEELYRVIHETGQVITMNNASFSEDGNTLLTCATDYTARTWNAHTGAPIDTLREHRNSVMTAIFNFDGSRILTASFDSTAKVWNLNKRDIQMDTTDAFFSIVKARLTGANLDFGRVAIDEVKDSLFTQYITNPTDYDFVIRKVYISGTNADEYTILTPVENDTIFGRTNESIKLSFSPKNIGQRNAILNIVFPGDTLRLNLLGEGFETGIQLLSDYIDFGQVKLGDFKDTVVTAVLKNRTLSNVTITSIQNIGPDTEHFDILSQTQNIVVPSGQTMPITLRFTPEVLGRVNGVILFNYDFTGSPAKLNVFGSSIDTDTDTMEIEIGQVSGAPGEIVELPINIKKSAANIENLTGIYTELSFNSTLLEPVNSAYPSEIIGDKRTLKLTINSDFSSEKLASIYFKVGLGNDTTSIIKMNNTAPLGLSNVKFIEKPGLFTLKGYCTEGGTRLFNPNINFTLTQNNPNPATSSTTISFELNENALTKLYIIDSKGSVVMNCINNVLNIGKYTYTINTETLPQGTYFYILESPNYKISKQMQIVK